VHAAFTLAACGLFWALALVVSGDVISARRCAQVVVREAPGVKSLHGFKPCAAPNTPCMPPADLFPLVRRLQ
jgi:hypothetical protein